jgi:hypothetical protein
LRDVSKSQIGLDRANLFHGVFETVLTELLAFDVFKFVLFLISMWANRKLVGNIELSFVLTRDTSAG